MLICLPVSLTSVSMVISTFFSEAGHSITLCFFMAEWRCFVSLYPICLVCSSVLLHLGCSVSLPSHRIARSEGTSPFCFLRTSILFSLECEVKWALEGITTNKASGGDGIPVELFQILKDGAVKSAALNLPANLENSAVATGLEKVSFHSDPKERQCQRMLKLPHNCTHLTC